ISCLSNSEIEAITLNILNDEHGLPGEVLFSLPLNSSYDMVYGNLSWLNAHRVDFPIENLVLPAGKYWLNVQTELENTFWVITSVGNHLSGIAMKIAEDAERETMGDIQINAVFYAEGECEILSLEELNPSQFAYYPNPAFDVLNIISSKSIQKVEVFNLAGQRVKDENKSIGKLNISSLTAGTYLFRLTLDGGEVETFKIRKK